MIYVLSDIHGQRRRFDSILEQISLRPDDTLYVLGDVIDRNPYGIQILRQIMAMPNAKMLLGNHELMMLKALWYPAPEDEPSPRLYLESRLAHWYRNGGGVTHRYLKHIRKSVRREIFEYLDRLPLNYELTVGGRNYILVHAAPTLLYDETEAQTRSLAEFAVWRRYDRFPVLENRTVIFGHTPTFNYNGVSPLTLWQTEGWIGIDCGCMLPETGDPGTGARGRLCCLRLDDGKVFYSEEPSLRR